jgi:photosystem I subunit 3
LAAASWPLAAFGAFTSGKLLESDDKITVSPR